MILFAVVFFSGSSALIYQTVWIKKFGLLFGVHVFSMATVLAAFMAGLALGALYFGRLADRSQNPVRLFLLLEAGIGLFALFFPITFRSLETAYTGIARLTHADPYALQLLRFSLAFIYLMIPTTLMGGTLPVTIKILVSNLGNLGKRVSLLYALNNLGAVFGGLVAGFVLMQALGLNPAAFVAAALNGLNILLVWLVVSRRNANEPVTGMQYRVESTSGSLILPDPIPPRILKLVLWVFALEGFTTLAYEILWTRILVDFSIDKTIYFSTVVITSFIMGLGLGSLAVSRAIDRSRQLLTWLALIEIGIGLFSVFLILVFSWVAPGISASRSMFGRWIIEAGREYLFFFLILLPPAMLMGITYPLVSKLVNDNLGKLGSRMGLLGFLDTIGSVTGSFAAGFILIPFMGVVRSLVLVVLINLLMGLLILVFHPFLKNRERMATIAGTIILSAILFAAMPKSRYTRNWWDKPENKPWFDANAYMALRFFHEGPSATVTVREYPEGLALNINGHNTAYATPKDLKVNRQLGYLPYLLHPNPKKALVIGFGMGATVSSLNQPGMERVDVAEICEGVLKAAPIFAKWNRDILNQPIVRVYRDDGRSVVNLAREQYDIITSNAIHPRLSNNIYTKDFYLASRNKLAPGGIVCQWLPENWMNEREYKALMKAFTDAFPYCSMWYVNEYSTLMLGSLSPLTVDVEAIVSRFERNPVLRADFAEFGMTSPYQFLGQYWMNDAELRAYTKDSPVNTDNFPLVEFSRVINLAPVPDVMDYLINHPVKYQGVFYNMGRVMPATEEMKNINDYATAEKFRMQSIVNIARAYMKNSIPNR